MLDKIDVTIATKNNEDTIGKCIGNIKKYIPYNRIIVVDDSIDNTPEIAKQLGAIVYHGPPAVGAKRYLQAELAETEWIAVIDSDVFIYENWWNEVSRYMANPNVGAIRGWLEATNIKDRTLLHYDAYTKFIALLQLDNPKGFPFSNTLIRRKFMLDSKSVLQKIHMYEDAAVSKTVIKQGYRIVMIPKILGMHYQKDPLGHAKMEYNRGGKSSVKARGKFRAITSIFSHSILTTYTWMRFSIYSHNFDFGLYKFLISLRIEFIKGVINGIRDTTSKNSYQQRGDE